MKPEKLHILKTKMFLKKIFSKKGVLYWGVVFLMGCDIFVKSNAHLCTIKSNS